MEEEIPFECTGMLTPAPLPDCQSVMACVWWQND